MMSSARTFGFIETGGKEGDFLSDNLFGMEDWGKKYFLVCEPKYDDSAASGPTV